MSELKELLSNPVQLIMTIVLMIVVGEWCWNKYKFLKSRADDYYSKRVAEDNFHADVQNVNQIVDEHTQMFENINSQLQRMNERLDDIEKQRDKDFVVSARTSLYQLYEILKDREYLTMSEYEAFDKLAQRYLDKKGNGMFKNVIIPTILDKPVKDSYSNED